MYSTNQLFNKDIFLHQQQGTDHNNNNNIMDHRAGSGDGLDTNHHQNHQFSGNNHNNNNHTNNNGTIGSLNQYNRKNSIFDHSSFQMNSSSSPITNPTDLASSDSNTLPSSEPIDPFKLNSSIWNQPQQNQNQNQQNQNQQNQNQNQQQNYNHTHFNSVSLPLSSQLGANNSQRRASYNDYYQMNQINNQNNQNNQPHAKFNTNYTIWPGNNNIDEYSTTMMYQSQIPQQGVQQIQQNTTTPQVLQPQKMPGDTGFLISPRRHSYTTSMDSPGFQPQQSINLDIPEDSQFNINSNQTITETTPYILNSYQNVDSYFTNDVYNRVTIKSSSISELSTSVLNGGATLPRFSGNSLPSTKLVLIAFKAGRIDVFYLPDNSPLILKLNDLVIVEADRGRDLGKIVKLDVSIDEARLLKYLQHQEQQSALASFDQVANSLNSSPPQSHAIPSQQGQQQNNQQGSTVPTLHFPKPIVRFAMPNEVYQIINKQHDEEKAKKICCLKIESSNLSMNVIDSEYQWDRRKLTFYYNATHRIDFRDLVRELFRIYKTRIWMCAVGSDVVDPSQPQSTGTGTGKYENYNWMEKKDATMFIPRQFSSPDQSVWKD